MIPDLYTPDQEGLEALKGRTVGREPIEAAIGAAMERLIAGRSSLPIYLYGARGNGKSHLVALARASWTPALVEAGIRVVSVPEETPTFSDADQLWARMMGLRPSWRDLRHGRAAPPEAGRVVVLLEGLDRQLAALGKKGRHVLRQRLQDNPGVWLLATGVGLGAALTDRDEALFGTFDTWDVPLLTVEQAAELARRVGATRRIEAICALAGGSPRAVIALAATDGEDPREQLADRLRDVLSTFTAHYQGRFLDLAPQAQEIVEAVAVAPRDVRSSELGELLGWSSATVSTVAGRLVDDGVLVRRTEGRGAWYTLAEPLFRHWLEYRRVPEEDSRGMWLARLLEAMLTHNDAKEWFDAARDLADQLAERESGALHPELEALWQRIQADADPNAWT